MLGVLSLSFYRQLLFPTTQGENKHLETLGFNSFPLALLAATLTTRPWIFGAFYHLNPVPIAYHIFLSKCDERERKGSGYGDCWYTSTFSFLHHLDFFVYFNQQQLSLAASRTFLTSSSLHLQPTTAWSNLLARLCSQVMAASNSKPWLLIYSNSGLLVK